MIKPFEFYFDFASPYTFIAHKEIRKIEKENSIKMKYMPILLGGLLKSAGIKANVDIPIKAKHMIKDCKLWAEKYNMPRGLTSIPLILIYFTGPLGLVLYWMIRIFYAKKLRFHD